MECSSVIVQGITILAPVTSPNTDGINPGEYAEMFLNHLEEHAPTFSCHILQNIKLPERGT